MSKKNKQTTETAIPSWLEAGSKQAVALGQKIAEREYTPFEGERIAGLDPSEQRAYEMASGGAGGYEADLGRAREFAELGGQSFLDADIEAYMNPYVKGALDPAAREIREETDRQVALRGQEAGMAGAFGGSRQAIAESETRRGGLEAVSDLYQKGYEKAYESGAKKFEADRNVAARASEQFRALGAQGQQQLTQDIQNLMTTGGLKRSLEQAGLDFDYQQFVEARDWDITNLQPLLAAISTSPHSTKTTQTSKQSGLGNVIGVAATVVGAVMTGGASTMLSAGLSAASNMFGGGTEQVGAQVAKTGGGKNLGTFTGPSAPSGQTGAGAGAGMGYAPAFYGSSYNPVAMA